MITDQEYIDASKIIGCEVASIRAVDGVESGGAGFLKSGKIKIKFEGHIFHKYTAGKYDKLYPTLSYPAWTEKYTQYGELAYDRFDRAFALDPHSAMMSTSWGRYQIMGFNWSSCGCKSLDELVTFLKVDEGNHLIAFCRYVKTNGLAGYLVLKNWPMFAYHYNGADYKKNHYDLLLQHEYEAAVSQLKSKPLIPLIK